LSGPFPLPKHLSRVRVPVNTPDGRIRPEATESGALVTHLMEPMETDAAIVRRAIEGDERAMRLLWNQHAPHVDAVVRRLAGDPDLAQDIAQEVWIQIFRALPSWRGDAKFSTWIHRVAINRTLNALRRVKRLAAAETGIEEDSAVVEQDADRGLLAQSIEAAARQLSPGARTVFLLHDVEGYTHEEIAAELGITPGGSKSQLFKARAKLRRLLAPLVDSLSVTSTGLDRSYAGG
jgi:RNA polymerase sigma-70 factor (ECF subfamily)